MNLLKDKVAVITGGTRGLGLAIAQAFAAEGASVVVASRSSASVEAAVVDITARGGKASGLAVNVSELAQVKHLADYAIQTYGKLDIWVNNAGVAGPYGPTLEFTPEAFYQVIQTNILGVYHGSRTAMQYFLPQHSGKLINLLGHGYNGPVPFQNAYAPSKAWIRSFTMALAEENKNSGVGVYAFNPGMVLTELLTDVDVIQGSEEKLKNFPFIVRILAKPAEVPAQKATWLASSATDGKTGLLVSIFSAWAFPVGALREGLRKLFKRPAPPLEIRMKSVPPAKDQ
jgi:NAD(P)-dependent dehydrogenase (short-subunit alcohol dehydrogenase family)